MAVPAVVAKAAARAAVKAASNPGKAAKIAVTICLAVVCIIFIPVSAVAGIGDYILGIISSGGNPDDTAAKSILEASYLTPFNSSIKLQLENMAAEENIEFSFHEVPINYLYAYSYLLGTEAESYADKEALEVFLESITELAIVEENGTRKAENRIKTVEEIEEQYPGFKNAYEKATGQQASGGQMETEVPAGGMAIPLFYQYDPAWSSIRYGDGQIYDSGCAPMCLSMVITYLKQETVTPADVVGYAGDMYWTSQGSSWGIFPAAAANWGLECNNLRHTDMGTVVSELNAGHPVIASMKAGTFAKAGHFIVLRGVTSDGRILVNDPWDTTEKNFKNRSFALDQIFSESKNFWSFSLKER